jgi:hypothetical protein
LFSPKLIDLHNLKKLLRQLHPLKKLLLQLHLPQNPHLLNLIQHHQRIPIPQTNSTLTTSASTLLELL